MVSNSIRGLSLEMPEVIQIELKISSELVSKFELIHSSVFMDSSHSTTEIMLRLTSSAKSLQRCNLPQK